MGKRKKRLLFDVLDDVVEERRKARGTPRPARPKATANRGAKRKKSGASTKSSGLQEIRITRDMGITIVVVMVAFVVCSYYSGLVHGRSGSGDDESPSLSRSGGAADASREDWGEHYAIQAYSESYGPYTIEQLGATFQDLQACLEDAGFSHIDVYDYPSRTEEGRGTLIMWVGRSEDRDGLEANATILRSLQFGDGCPFSSAYVTLFTD